MEEYQFRTTPYDHQLEAFEKFKNASHFALFMDMGTGKTKTDLDIAGYKFTIGEIDRLLVIAPNGVHEQWVYQQIPEHCNVSYMAFVWKAANMNRRGHLNSLKTFLSPHRDCLRIFCMNVESFQSEGAGIEAAKRFIGNGVGAMVTIDESTKIKNPNAKRTKSILRITAACTVRNLLTGTPAAKSAFDLFQQMEFLKRNFWGCNYFAFKHRHGLLMRTNSGPGTQSFYRLIDEETFARIAKRLQKADGEHDDDAIGAHYGVSGSVVANIRVDPTFHQYRNLDRIQRTIAPVTAIARKEDCLDLPPKVYQQIHVDMPIAVRKVYADLQRKLIAEYENKVLTIENRAALVTRLMQVAGGYMPYYENENAPVKHVQIGTANAKLKALVDIVEDCLPDRSIIVWARFSRLLEGAYVELQKLEPKTALYYGKTDTGKRPGIISDFEKGKVRILVTNPAMVGYGFNFQHCRDQIFIGNSFQVEHRLQAEDRSHRKGVQGSCTYLDILMNNSIDGVIFKAIQSGREVNEFFKDKSLMDIVYTAE